MVKFLPQSEIEVAAESFLRQHHQGHSLPIPIEDILDLRLRINIVPVPGLFNLHNIDAFLSTDLNELYIDHDHLEYRYNRARYSMAHEAGHLVLHENYLKSLKIDSLDKWKEIVLGKGTGHAMMETQANMFASFLLMPRDAVEQHFEEVKEELRSNKMFLGKSIPEDSVIAPFVAGKIARIFDVSEEAAQYRLLNLVNAKKL